MSYIISRPWGGHCGIGHQFFNWLTARLLANRYGLTHVHSPFCGNVIEPQIDIPVKKWERFLGFGDSMVIESTLPKGIRKIQIPKVKWDEASYHTVTCDHPTFKQIIQAHRNEDVLFECAKDQFVGLGWEWLNTRELRQRYDKFHHPSKTCLSYRPLKTNVAIHIRRGDITKNGRYRVRWVSDIVYLNVIWQLRRIYPDAKFHIFSDAKEIELSNFVSEDTVIHSCTNVLRRTTSQAASAAAMRALSP